MSSLVRQASPVAMVPRRRGSHTLGCAPLRFGSRHANISCRSEHRHLPFPAGDSRFGRPGQALALQARRPRRRLLFSVFTPATAAVHTFLLCNWSLTLAGHAERAAPCACAGGQRYCFAAPRCLNRGASDCNAVRPTTSVEGAPLTQFCAASSNESSRRTHRSREHSAHCVTTLHCAGNAWR
jgi:hypothetical protein